MSDFLDMIGTGLVEFEAQVPSTITIGGTGYACVFSDLTQTDTAEAGGFVSDYDAIAIVRKSVLATAPATQARVTAGGKTYRIESVIDDDPAWHLNLKTSR